MRPSVVEPQILIEGINMTETNKQKRILETYVQEMLSLSSKGDTQIVHQLADDLVLRALQDAGLGALVEAYRTVEKEVGGFEYA